MYDTHLYASIYYQLYCLLHLLTNITKVTSKFKKNRGHAYRTIYDRVKLYAHRSWSNRLSVVLLFEQKSTYFFKSSTTLVS